MTLEEKLAEAEQHSKTSKNKKEEVRKNVDELTRLKLQAAEERIKEIDTKITALQKERDNLIRKNENRRLSLEERK